jgi:TPR repeat protein
MLGQCLLDGVGIHRDRANALEWLVTAAELGHILARERVILILNEEYENLNAGATSNQQEQRIQEEAIKWMNSRDQIRRAVNIERRHTIGGGTNRAVLATRQSKVEESRDATTTASSNVK